ncbi:MAG: AAA family ATPase, partial [Bacillota bacterium]|nr:AAA family ATPase [Bacillota bacterium]
MNENNKLWEQVNRWENEVENNGFLSNETQLFSTIESLSPDDHREELSRLMTIAALSRVGRNKNDAVCRYWMKTALDLNPLNEKATNYLHIQEWKNKKDLLQLLTFPTIRETDNRTTKKKIADDYIRICRQFIDVAEKEVNEQNLRQSVAKNETIQSIRLQKLLSEALDETLLLLKAAEDYEESITGVFHTSTHFQDLKQHTSNIEDIQKQWRSSFDVAQVNSEEAVSLRELNEMIGLKTVKERISDFYRFLQFQEERKSNGFHTKDELSLNMVLTGNPGTGKTTLARLLAKIYNELGVLPRQEVIEADRSQLVGSFVGQT